MAYSNVAARPHIPKSRLSLVGTQPETPKLRPVSPENADTHRLALLLEIESETRKASSLDEWKYVIANETLKITNAVQIFVFHKSRNLDLIAISGLTGFDRSTPLVKSIEKLIGDLQNNDHTQDLTHIQQISVGGEKDDFLASYPFSKLLWVPLLSRGGEVLGGKLLAKSDDWQKAEQTILKRLADTYSHALCALQPKSGIRGILADKFKPGKKKMLLAAAMIIGMFLMPVSMTVLAPFEVAPVNPVIVAAPIEGIIDKILVDPNERVVQGQKLVIFNDTEFKNKLALAEKEIGVAQARLKKSGLLAFDEQQGLENIGLSMANHSLKVTEKKYASDLLERAVIKADQAGIVLFSDKQELLGKPLKPGERIMQIADPTKPELLIDIPTSDAIILKEGAQAKIYLDSDPLNARQAQIEYINYQARERPGTGLSFRVIARFTQTSSELPSLGVRGTAKLYGETVPLAFYLFRKPLSAFRQWLGL